MPVVRTDGRTDGRWCTVTLSANFLGWVDYHIYLAMGLQRRAWNSANNYTLDSQDSEESTVPRLLLSRQLKNYCLT